MANHLAQVGMVPKHRVHRHGLMQDVHLRHPIAGIKVPEYRLENPRPHA